MRKKSSKHKSFDCVKKSTSGITLIALVITIIVLLILAGASLSAVFGENGIINKATGAKKEFEIASAKESIELAVLEMQMDKRAEKEYCSLEYVKDNISNSLPDITIVGSKGNPIDKLYVKQDGHQFEIRQDGEVVYIGDVEFNEIPDLAIIRDTTVTGAEKVTLELLGDVEIGSIKKIITPTGEITGTNGTYEITQNGEYKFTIVTDKDLQIEKTVNIQNIKEDGIDLTTLTTGDDITHSHIYETKYNDTEHWEQCFMCNDIQNEIVHNLVVSGTESCLDAVPAQVQYCNDGCGYSNELPKKAHVISDTWYAASSDRNIHYKACTVCGIWTNEEICKNGEGIVIGCTTGTTGVCATCGSSKAGDKHGSAFIYEGMQSDGKYHLQCSFCRKTIAKSSHQNVTELDDLSTKVTWQVYLEDEFKLSGKNDTGCWTPVLGATYGTAVLTEQSDGSYIAETTVTYSKENTVPSIYGLGIYCYYASLDGVENGWFLLQSTVKSDNSIPVAQSITAENSEVIGEYARKATITASFTEEIDDVVQMALYDGETMLADWGTATKNGTTFTRTFDVISETSSSKTLTVKAKDSCGNIGEGTVTISKLDSKAPTIKSITGNSTTWSIRKNVKLEIIEEGIGNVSIAFNNPNNYELLENIDGKYTKSYNFIGDVYTDLQGAIYLKDGLGNMTTEKIDIGKIDSTSPTIESAIKTGTTLTVTANDMNATLQKEGSGIAGYAISTTKELPGDSLFQIKNTFEVEEGKTYYVWVKDNAGNFSEASEVK